MKTHRLIPCLSVLALLAACEKERPPIDLPPGTGTTPLALDAAAVTNYATQSIQAHALGLDQSTDFTKAMQVLDDLNINLDLGPASAPQTCAPGAPCPVETPEQRAARAAAETVADLFGMDTVELAEPTRVTYRLRADRACGQLEGSADRPSSGSGGGGAPQPQPPPPESDCARMLNSVPVRLIVTSLAEGDLDITIAVAEARYEPVTIRLYRARISIEVDLAELKPALEALLNALPAGDRPPLPDRMSGRLVFDLTRSGTKTYTASLGFATPIEIASVTTGDRYSLRTAAKSPAFSATLDGDARRIRTTADVGQTDLSFPLSWTGSSCDEPAPVGPGEPAPPPCEPVRGTLGVLIAGARAIVTVDGTSDTVAVDDVSLGQSTSRATFDGVEIARVDLNASHGRAFDLNVGRTEPGVEATFRPAFDLQLVLALAPLAAQLQDIPTWAHRETLGVKLDGASAPKVRFPRSTDAAPPVRPGDPTPPPPAEAKAVLAILDGVLSLSSQSVPSIRVPAGQCLLQEPAVRTSTSGGDGGSGGTGSGTTDDPHPFSRMHAGACP